MPCAARWGVPLFEGALAASSIHTSHKGNLMKPVLRSLAAAMALALASLTAVAQTPAAPAASAATPGVDKRQANQDRRIDQGVASGQLTRREARRLERQQAAIDRAEGKAKADGTVTTQERKRLHRMENEASRDIHHQKHDRQRRGASAPRS